jgi:hypothetical protein
LAATPEGNNVTTALNKLDILAKLCKAGVHVRYNDHTTNYETIPQYLQRRSRDEGHPLAPDVFDAMVDNDLVVEVQFYPDTPISSYVVIGHNLDALLDEAITIVRDNRRGAFTGLTDIITGVTDIMADKPCVADAITTIGEGDDADPPPPLLTP